MQVKVETEGLALSCRFAKTKRKGSERDGICQYFEEQRAFGRFRRRGVCALSVFKGLASIKHDLQWGKLQH